MTAPVGSLAEEAALLAAVLRDRAGSAAEEHPRCTGCPVCRASTALQASAPQLAAAAGVALVAVRDLVRTARAAYQSAGTASATGSGEPGAWR